MRAERNPNLSDNSNNDSYLQEAKNTVRAGTFDCAVYKYSILEEIMER